MEDKQYRVNEKIRVPEVRLISEDGQQLGVVRREEALARARDAGLDLVEVAPNERPPVCRIMDFGKFKYMQRKKSQKSHSHQMKVKEVRVRPRTGEHDLQVKINRARQFLEQGHKVIVSVLFRGRELAHIEEGTRVLEQVLEAVQDVGKPDGRPSRQGLRRIVCTISPLPGVRKQKQNQQSQNPQKDAAAS
ncbi:MAG: translation initiation factor IF-3 [Planctomycetota bacterium]|nr:MAG: translation initiation factor IF-3 [Planctomycetota bacterium]